MSTNFEDLILRDTRANQPAASIPGRLYCVTDEDDIIERDNGATWEAYSPTGGGAGSDTTAIHDSVSGEIAAITAKGTPVSADLLLIEDSEDGNAKKSIQIGDLPTGGGGAVITEGAYASIPGSPTNNDVYLATDGQLLNHRAAGAWVPFGPLPKLTLPIAVTGAATTLNNGGTMNSGDTSCTITSAAGFPAAPFFIVIESETILVGAISGTTLSSLTRGYNGTSAASHADSTAVTLKNWIWANQGASTVDQAMGPTVMTSQTAGGQTLRALYRNAPTSTPYTVTALVCRENREHINYIGCGIAFRENSSGKWLSFGPSEADGAFAYEVMRWNSTTAYTSAAKSGGSSMGILPFNWMQIKDDGSSLYFYTSGSGLPGTFVLFYSAARNAFFTTAPDGIGMMLYQENGSTPSVASFWSWEVS